MSEPINERKVAQVKIINDFLETLGHGVEKV